MFPSKGFAALFALAITAGVGVYLGQRSQVQSLQAENQNLSAQLAQVSAEHDAAAQAVQAAKTEVERLQKGSAELLRLRNEVSLLRRERDAQKQRASQLLPPAALAVPSATELGRYISKEQLAFVGYATPDAALESTTWAMMNGTYEQTIACLGPEFLKDHERDEAKDREQFEAGRAKMAPLFRGIQVVARKTLAEDRVELKIKMDAGPMPGSKADMPPFLIQPMVKVGTDWKLGGSTRGYQPEWDSSAQTQ
jgi:hypothetical protein